MKLLRFGGFRKCPLVHYQLLQIYFFTNFSGYAGKTKLDQFKVEMIVDIIDDLLRPLLQALYTDNEEEKVKYYLGQDLPYFSNLEQFESLPYFLIFLIILFRRL